MKKGHTGKIRYSMNFSDRVSEDVIQRLTLTGESSPIFGRITLLATTEETEKKITAG